MNWCKGYFRGSSRICWHKAHNDDGDKSIKYASKVFDASDASIPAFLADRPIIIFDGHCVLCSGFARFVLRNDRRKVFRLMAAQTPLGQAIYSQLGLDTADFETNVLLEDGRAWFKSSGTIRMFVHLGFPWSIVAILRVVPRRLLDRLYDFIARHRLQWFGSQQMCFLVDPAHKERFLE